MATRAARRVERARASREIGLCGAERSVGLLRGWDRRQREDVLADYVRDEVETGNQQEGREGDAVKEAEY